MKNNKKTLKTALSSSIAVIIVALILFQICLIFRRTNLRLDFTEDKLYTLSAATRNALSSLDKNVTIRFYYSKDLAQMPVALKNYAKRVDDMLREYEIHAGKRIKVERLNPKPDSDAEDSATLDGIAGQGMDALGLDRNIYMGVSVRCGSQLEAIPFLSPSREDLLEYDLTRAIISVVNPVKRKVGIMSSMKVMGGIENPQMMLQGQGGVAPAWFIVSELKKRYAVSEVDMSVDKIPDDIDILIVIHPSNASDKLQFALDQFVLRGGRLLAFLDPICLTDLQMRQQRQQLQYQAPDSKSSLPVLLKAWGLEFNESQVVIDRKCATAIRHNASGGAESMPNILTLSEENIATKEPATAQVSNMVLLDAGAFSGTVAEGLEKTVLLQSSNDAAMLDNYATQQNGEDMLRAFTPSGSKYELMLRLTGKFKTAFPNGAPDRKEGEADTALKDAKQPGAVMLVGDADMLYDAFCVSRTNFFGQTLYSPINDNCSIVQNLLEALSGDVALFDIRSRGVKQRPFKKVHDLELQASEKFKDEIRRFEEEVQNVQRQLFDMQRTRKNGDKELLSKEQQQAILTIKRKEAEARKNLKKVRRDMRHDVESLENRLMVLNIGLMPLLVIVFGVVFAFIRRRA